MLYIRRYVKLRSYRSCTITGPYVGFQIYKMQQLSLHVLAHEFLTELSYMYSMYAALHAHCMNYRFLCDKAGTWTTSEW